MAERLFGQMSFHQEIKRAIEDQGVAFDEFVKTYSAKFKDLVTENGSLRERLEEIESREVSPRAYGTAGRDLTPTAREHYKRFCSWIRKSADPHVGQQLAQ